MASPGRRTTRRPSHPASHIPNYSHFDDAPYPVPTRSGALASLIRSRSASSLYRHPLPSPTQPQDEEAAAVDAAPATGAAGDDDIARLLANERRLSQILQGPRARSMSLIGKSNPRYRWETYWKRDDELRAMPSAL